MAFNSGSFLAGVGTVFAALLAGFGSAYIGTTMLGDAASRQPSKLERRGGEAASAQQAISPMVSPIAPAQAAAQPAPQPASPAPPRPAPQAAAPAPETVRASRAELVQPSAAELRRQQRTRDERRRLRAERKQQQLEMRAAARRSPELAPPVIAGREAPFSPFRVDDD